MKTTVIERRAELLRLYTGLPWQSARRRVEAAEPGSLLIPHPDADQLLLEARVMAAWPGVGSPLCTRGASNTSTRAPTAS